MELRFSEEEQAFRDEVRAFLTSSVPGDLRAKFESGAPLAKADYVRWQKLLYERGWIAPAWPKAYGGAEWNAARQYIFALEIGLFGAPKPIPFGLNMVGPVIYTFGSEEQKRRHLPPILSSDVWWAQGFSEPGAGSDLAALAMSARRDGNDYVLNGTKLWTTMAHWADWIFCLVRTSKEERPQEGISFLLVDMSTPGISVESIITIDGGHHVNEVRFSDVRVPVANRVGEEGKGWSCAKFLLANERQAIADVGSKKRMLLRLRALAAATPTGDGTLLEDPDFATRLAALDIEVRALELTELRFLDAAIRGEERGYEPSLLKLRATELQQALSELYVSVLGYYALPYPGPESGRNEPGIGPPGAAAGVAHFLHSRAATIYGGTNEIQRNIMAKLLLGA